MKSLPQEFPIRYALIVTDNFKKEDVKDDFDLSTKNTLWSQFVRLIKKKPLGLEDLCMRYVALKYSDADDNKLFVIPKLNGAKEWTEELRTTIQDKIPQGSYSNTWGNAFDLNFYSYQGMIERPLYSRILNGLDKEKVLTELQLRELNYLGLDGLRLWVQKKYKSVLEGNSGLWQKYSVLNEPLVFYIDIPYSRLWKLLDQGKNGGIASSNGSTEAIENAMKKPDEIDENKIITVAIARDLEALLFEEMIAVYKISNFCRCCHKPLPLGRSIFCPNTKENIECRRKRDRIRQKKREK